MEDAAPRFIPDGSEPEPDPLADAMRVLRGLRHGIRKAVKPMEILCKSPGCEEWARFRTDAPSLLCPAHARVAQKEHGAKLWHFAQPAVVYELHELLMRHTVTERKERRDAAVARFESDRRGTTLEQLEYQMGKDLVVEASPADDQPLA